MPTPPHKAAVPTHYQLLAAGPNGLSRLGLISELKDSPQFLATQDSPGFKKRAVPMGFLNGNRELRGAGRSAEVLCGHAYTRLQGISQSSVNSAFATQRLIGKETDVPKEEVC